MRTSGVLLAAVAAVAGCTSNPRPEATAPASIQTTRIAGGGDGGATNITTTTVPTANVARFAAPMNRTWAALREAYDSVGIPVATVDETQHVLGNTGFKLRRRLGGTPLSRYIDCGAAQGGPNAETYEVFLAVATQLQPATVDGWTQATTSVQASAKPVSFAGEYVNCTSNGALEARISETVKSILQR